MDNTSFTGYNYSVIDQKSRRHEQSVNKPFHYPAHDNTDNAPQHYQPRAETEHFAPSPYENLGYESQQHIPPIEYPITPYQRPDHHHRPPPPPTLRPAAPYQQQDHHYQRPPPPVVSYQRQDYHHHPPPQDHYYQPPPPSTLHPVAPYQRQDHHHHHPPSQTLQPSDHPIQHHEFGERPRETPTPVQSRLLNDVYDGDRYGIPRVPPPLCDTSIPYEYGHGYTQTYVYPGMGENTQRNSSERNPRNPPREGSKVAMEPLSLYESEMLMRFLWEIQNRDRHPQSTHDPNPSPAYQLRPSNMEVETHQSHYDLSEQSSILDSPRQTSVREEQDPPISENQDETRELTNWKPNTFDPQTVTGLRRRLTDDERNLWRNRSIPRNVTREAFLMRGRVDSIEYKVNFRGYKTTPHDSIKEISDDYVARHAEFLERFPDLQSYITHIIASAALIGMIPYDDTNEPQAHQNLALELYRGGDQEDDDQEDQECYNSFENYDEPPFLGPDDQGDRESHYSLDDNNKTSILGLYDQEDQGSHSFLDEDNEPPFLNPDDREDDSLRGFPHHRYDNYTDIDELDSHHPSEELSYELEDPTESPYYSDDDDDDFYHRNSIFFDDPDQGWSAGNSRRENGGVALPDGHESQW
ncbi:unnamed protein product [Periconia digitata]|uniref:Uncharacterized protein n=1 Tax=Periconia digitata TaxID=1303443 RepID=A0A9W4U6S3_9PLEO|nr:unnamed protein product [Periconia digitata]